MNANAIKLTSDNFAQTVLNSDVPVVVDFWAAWCGPCRLVGPIVEDLATEFVDRARVGKLNVDEESEIASQYAISAIPTLLFFQNGQVVDTVIGIASKRELVAKLTALLERKKQIAA